MALGFTFYGNSINATGRAAVTRCVIGKSTTIYAGQLLVRTSSSTYCSASYPNTYVVRPYNYGTSDTLATTTPPFAVALYDVTTDSSGNVITTTSPVTVDGQKRVQYALPSEVTLGERDPQTGFMMVETLSLGGGNLFVCALQSGDVSSQYQLNRACGVAASGTTQPITYTVNDDAAAANAPFVITKVDSQDPLYMSASGGGRVIGEFLASFNGAVTGNVFTT